MVLTRLSRAVIIPLIPLTLDITPARMNFRVRNTKYPPAIDEAIGNPTSATSLKKSIKNPLDYYFAYLLYAIY
jgi:hypothetical protein